MRFAAKANGTLGTIPNDGGGTVWIDKGTRIVKAQGLTIGNRYLFNLVGFLTF